MDERAAADLTLVEPDARTGKANSSVTIIKLSSVHEAGLLLPLVRAWHAESIYHSLPFSERKYLAAYIKTLQRQNTGASFYALYKKRPVGLIDIAVGEAWLSEGGCYATCLAWFVHPTLRKSLLRARVASQLMHLATRWAEGLGAIALHQSKTNRKSSGHGSLGATIGVNILVPLGRSA